MRAGWLLALVLALGLGAGLRDAADRWIARTPLPPLNIAMSPEVLARDGSLLRAFLVADGRWRLTLRLDQVDPDYLRMLIRYEDKRFYDHHGVDLRAMARALGLAVRHGRVVSGGSTLTMQVARLLEDGPTGQVAGKIRQIRLALALERRLSKAQILTLYVNRAPFGGNLEGLRAASLAYFRKPPQRLTPAQAAMLVALPQSPETRRPDRHPRAAEAARNRVLARMVRDGILPPAEATAARTEPAPGARHAFPALAAHLADRARGAADRAGQTITRTTLDRGLQAALEALAQRAVQQGGSDRRQVALMVADHRSGEILASVGSAAYAAGRRQGFVDMTQALRSPGSTLKPVIYGLAFSQGLAHPETLIDDRPQRFGTYAPQNFDGRFRGQLPLRDALQLSLNLPAVALLDRLGPARLLAALRQLGARPALQDPEPGLAIALGGLGLSLEDTLRAYAAIASGGVARDLRWQPGPSAGFVPRRVLSPAAAWQVADILRDTPRPAGMRGAGIAFKTGTSYGYRDGWAFGFDGRHVVGVWVGRADGTPIPGAFGGETAAPLLFEVFARLGPVVPLPPPPPETLIVSRSQLPAPLRQIGPDDTGARAPEIGFPPDGARLDAAGFTARLREGTPPFTWLANGRVVGRGTALQQPIPDLGPGFSTLVVLDGAGHSARTRIELRGP